MSLKARIIWAFVGLTLIMGSVGLLLYYQQSNQQPSTGPTLTTPEPEAPQLQTSVIAEGYSNIWDLAFVDSQTIIFNERAGQLHGLSLDNNETWQITGFNQLQAQGEGGFLGLAQDIDFATNRIMYGCYNSVNSPRRVRVARFVLNEDTRSVGNLTEIITDIESQAGRHSGCRMQMDREGVLWIGTGDSAIGASPQNPRSLAGKVLRVDRNGQPASGNLGSPFDPRIYSYGHRNIQGLVLFNEPMPNGARGFTAEHGPGVNDEVNWLVSGNFGWDPNGLGGRYDESVSMTDTVKYPEALEAVWRSGSSTIAPSGITLLTHERWGLWQNRLAMAVLKDRHVRLLDIAEDGTVRSQQELLSEFGRVRSVRQAPDGDLFITTDNGNGRDQIIRVTPK